MAELPRDKKPPPSLKPANPPSAAKPAVPPVGVKAGQAHVGLPSLGEQSTEGLPLVMVDLGSSSLPKLSEEQTLILPAKLAGPRPDKPLRQMGAAPVLPAKPGAPPVDLGEATLILEREDKRKQSVPAAAQARPTAAVKATASPRIPIPAAATIPAPIPAPGIAAMKAPIPAPPLAASSAVIVAPNLAPHPVPALPSIPAPAPAAKMLPAVKAPPAASTQPAPVETAALTKPTVHPEKPSLEPRKIVLPQPPSKSPPKVPAGVVAPPQPPSKKPTQQRIRELIHRFDVPALLDALRNLGYRDEQIEFMSNPVLSHQAALLEDIEFLEDPPRVLILTNLGLLSGQGPIPSYFYQLLSEQRDTSMTEFLWFFDNALLRQRFSGLFPERDTVIVPDWGEVKRLQLALLQLGAPVGMHWLFRQVYPELPISVQRSVQKRRVRTEGVLMGAAELGSGCAFGGFTQVPVGGIDVRLLCEEWNTPTGKPWAHEAEQRLKRLVMPALESGDLFLTVTLVFLDRQSFAKLAPQHFLGYEPIAVPPSDDLPPPVQQVILFQGEVGHNPH